MPITRDKASRVLTETEMGLFGDSRSSAVRALSEKALASRVERTRKLRDKSRDLLQRQKLKSRASTGSKLGASGVANQRTATKGEILDDILQRFEIRLMEVQSADKAVARTTKPTPKTRTSATSKSAAVGIASTVSAAKPAKAATARPGKAENRDDANKAQQVPRGPNSAVKPKASRARNKPAISPERALANTRALLDAKQQRDRETPAYLAIDSHPGTDRNAPGYQSGVAKAKALELHEGEMRMQAIQGSISIHDRHNQGERDGR